MAKRRTYEQILYDNLMGKLEHKKWYDITKKPDYDRMVIAIKQFIDNGEPFLFSNDYRKIRVDKELLPQRPIWHLEDILPEGMTIEHIPAGSEVSGEIKGRQWSHIMKKECWQIYIHGKNIATEN